MRRRLRVEASATHVIGLLWAFADWPDDRGGGVLSSAVCRLSVCLVSYLGNYARYARNIAALIHGVPKNGPPNLFL